MSDTYKEYYGQLIGATITRFIGMDGDDYKPFPVFRAKLLDGQWVLLSISADEEGNHGGFIFIEEDEEMNKEQALRNKQWQLAMKEMEK